MKLPQNPILDKLNLYQVGFNNQSKVKDFDLESVRAFLNRHSGGEKIITTRLDNDDMLMPNYVRAVQTIAKLKDKALIELNGYWYDLRTGKLFHNHRYKENLTSPFISLVETPVWILGKNDNDLKTKYYTAYFRKHSDMGKIFTVIISEVKGWIQVLHNSNQKMNKLKAGQLGKEISPDVLPKWTLSSIKDAAGPISSEDDDYMNYLLSE